MAIATDVPRLAGHPGVGRGRAATAALLLVGGALTALGGALHPQGSGSSFEAHLLSMFAAPGWPLAHGVLLAGAAAATLALAAWGFVALELVPHLLAAGEAHELAHHEATPVLDVHLVMQVLASPVVGLTGALFAVLVARASGSRVAWLLAVPAVVGGVASAGAAPLTVLTGDPRFTVLFPFQAGLAVWLFGTGLRLLRH